jgi:hypothetical protein
MQSTKHIQTVVLCTGLAALAFSGVLAASGKKHGTDILHFSVRETMSNSGGLTNASGKVNASQNQQGKANNQRLDVVLKNLDPAGTYQLQALLGDATNWTQVTEFQSDEEGNAALYYRQVGSSNGRGKGLGRGKHGLPAALDPISQIRELAISMNSTQMVLHADLTSPDKLQYLIKRDLSTDAIHATLRLKATLSQTQFRLTASGLNPTNEYLLALNGTVVQSENSNENGQLVIDALLNNPGDVLDLHSIQVWHGTNNVVLSTTLP